jgi:hypothetical protein
MLLIVIATLGVALVVQHHRAARREAELQARMELLNYIYELTIKSKEAELKAAGRHAAAEKQESRKGIESE